MASIINATTTNGLSTSADNSGSLQLATNNGTTAVTIDTAQQIGVGTTSPSNFGNSNNRGITVNGQGTAGFVEMQSSGTAYGAVYANSSNAGIRSITALPLTFETNATERMRITSAGDVVMGGGTSWDYSVAGFGVSGSGSYTYATRSDGYALLVNRKTSTGAMQAFTYNGSGVGDISTNGSNCTFNSTSDYRLKQNIQPMTDALARVELLKPVTYNWIRENQAGEGFIAHELQEVVPEAVTGTKDAVDEDGNPVYQAIDQSVLVATLTAAIQELKAIVDAQAIEIAELKAK